MAFVAGHTGNMTADVTRTPVRLTCCESLGGGHAGRPLSASGGRVAAAAAAPVLGCVLLSAPGVLCLSLSSASLQAAARPERAMTGSRRFGQAGLASCACVRVRAQ